MEKNITVVCVINLKHLFSFKRCSSCSTLRDLFLSAQAPIQEVKLVLEA